MIPNDGNESRPVKYCCEKVSRNCDVKIFIINVINKSFHFLLCLPYTQIIIDEASCWFFLLMQTMNAIYFFWLQS